MEESTSTSVFPAEIHALLDSLTRLAKLRVSDISGDVVREMQHLADEVALVEESIKTVNTALDREEAALEEAKALEASLREQNTILTHMKANLPQHLPGAYRRQALSSAIDKENVSPHDTTAVSVAADPYDDFDQSMQSSSSGRSSRATSAKRRGKSTKAQEAKRRKKAGGRGSPPPVPSIEPVTKDELNAVPRYLKGRLTQDRLNNAVGDLNDIVQRKYRILHDAKLHRTKEKETKILKKYMQQETKDTKGLFFFMETDMRKSAHLKQDQTGKAIMNVLRKLNRLSVLPGSDPRYVVSE